jgi:hypothetical protein
LANAIPTEQRFWRFVHPEPNTGCMLWGGGQFPTGYGSFMLPTPKGWRARYAHRLAWEMAHGPIPPGLFVCHRCDVRACVNVDHLFLGTNADNMRDAKSKGRHAHGERHGRTKLTEAQVVDILDADGTQEAIAARYGLTRQAVSDIRRGARWKHVSHARPGPRWTCKSPKPTPAAESEFYG